MARRKSGKTTSTSKNTSPLTSPPPPVAPVVLLIDGENVTASDLIAHILVEAGKMGGVTIRRVYGNWAAPTMQAWKKVLAHYALEWEGSSSSTPGPNATDIALVIGAMDLLSAGIRHFCLVAGDSDYVPLVHRLRKDGCTVVVIGTSAASTALKEASSQFLTTDQLLPHATPTQASRTAVPPTELPRLLTEAYRLARQGSETEWVLLSAMGLALRRLVPHFEETYGKQQLSIRLQQYPDLFELRQRTSGNGEVGEARLRAPLQNVS